MATRTAPVATDVDATGGLSTSDDPNEVVRELRALERRRKSLELKLTPEVDTSPRPEDGDQPTDQTPLDTRASEVLSRATPKSVLALARGQRGHREGPTNDNKFGRWYGWDNVPWCAIFASWVFHRAGLPLPATSAKGFASCSAGRDWFRKNRRFKPAGTVPKPGWLIFFDWNGKEPLDHVGIVIEPLPDGRILTIEGNTTSPVSPPFPEGVFEKKRRAGIVGYGVPDFHPPNDADALPELEQGAHGPPVRRLQGLIRAAFPELRDETLSLGGDFGPITKDYVTRFRARHDLEPDGEVGPKTWRALLGLKR